MLYRLAICALACAAAGAQTRTNPFAGSPEVAESGRAVFRVYCTPCHGIRAQGGHGPDLTRGVYSHGGSDDDLFRTISDGVAGTEMPEFKGDINEADIWRIIVFLRSIARHDAAGIPGDRARGEALFWGKGACGQCHQVHAKGGHLGPDLTRIGVERSLAYLRESVIDPNARVEDGYATVTVIRLDGTRLVGVERGFDNFSVQLMDAGGNYYSFLRTGIKSARREFRSLMPDNYGRLFQPAQLDDLIAYLTSLRGGEAPQ